MGKPYPIATTDVEPDSFYYYLTPDGYRLCAEVVDVPYLDALDRFGAGLDGNGRVTAPVKGLKPGDAYGLPRPEWSRAMGGTGTLTLTELWDPVCCTYVLNGPGQTSDKSGRGLGRGTVVKRVKHGYGDPWTSTLKGPLFSCLRDHHRLAAPGAGRAQRALPLPLPVPRPGQLPHHPEQRRVPHRLPHLQAHPAPGGHPGRVPGAGGGAQRGPLRAGRQRAGRPGLADHDAGAGHHLPLGRGPDRDAPQRHRDRQGHRRHHGLPGAGPARLRPRGLRRATTAGTPSTRRPTWPAWPGTPS